MTKKSKTFKTSIEQIESAIDDWPEQSAKVMLKECLRSIYFARPEWKNWGIALNEGLDEIVNKETDEKFSSLLNIPTPGWRDGERKLCIKRFAELNGSLKENQGKARRFIDEVDFHVEVQILNNKIDAQSFVEEREQLKEIAETSKKLCRQIERSGLGTNLTLRLALEAIGHPELADIKGLWKWAKYLHNIAGANARNMSNPVVSDQIRGGQLSTDRDIFVEIILRCYFDRFNSWPEQLENVKRLSAKEGGSAYAQLNRHIIRFCELAGLVEPDAMLEDSMSKVTRPLKKMIQKPKNESGLS